MGYGLWAMGLRAMSVILRSTATKDLVGTIPDCSRWILRFAQDDRSDLLVIAHSPLPLIVEEPPVPVEI